MGEADKGVVGMGKQVCFFNDALTCLSSSNIVTDFKVWFGIYY
jgi:hypothetical protein